MSKAIAIIDRPENCQKCWFSACHYSLPLSTRRKGYSCRIQNYDSGVGVVVEDFDYDEEVHLKNCPLREVPQKHTIHCIDTTHHRHVKQGWNACIDAILKGGAD